MRWLLIVAVPVCLIIVGQTRGMAAEERADSSLKCGYFGDVRQSGTPYRTIDTSASTDERKFQEKKIFVANDLIDRYNYYACESYWYGNFWGFLSISVVILTAASSLLAAFNIGAWHYGKFVLAGTSALAALMSTILVQFHIKDTWQLRENGQLTIQTMLENVRNISFENKEPIQSLSKIHMRAIELERSQATQFFGQISTSGDGTGKPP